MNRIRIDRLRVRRERPWLEVLPIEPPDPNVAGAKALARAQQAGISSSSGPLPGIYTRLASSLGEWVAVAPEVGLDGSQTRRQRSGRWKWHEKQQGHDRAITPAWIPNRERQKEQS